MADCNLDLTDFTAFPECPGCREVYQDYWDGLKVQGVDGTELTLSCPGCGIDFIATVLVEVSFATRHEKVSDG